MALPVTDQLTNQMMNESVRVQPTSPMEGNVTRPRIIEDLINLGKDVNFSQLIEEYGSMAGLPSETITPMTKALMAERERIPETPLKAEATTPPVQPTAMPTEEIKVPTPMTNAMAMNTMAPIGSVAEQNGGLMAQSKGLQKPV